MANTLNLGNGDWATKENSLLGYNSENDAFKPLPFDFTRASNGTFINKSGLIETAANGVPRINFLGNTKGALLLEPQRTNLLPYSSDFSNASWVKTNVTLTSSNVISPDGTQNASKIEATASDSSLQDSITVTSGTTYTLSVYLKTVSGTLDTAIGLGSPGFPQNEGEGGRYKNITVTNEWKRYTLTSTADASAATGIGVGGFNSFSTGEEVYVWGAQLEVGSYATSLINTQGSAVTRVQDVCKIVNSPILQAANQFTLFFDAKDFVNYGATFANIMITLGAGESPYDAGSGIHIYNKIWYYFNGSSAVTLGNCYNATTDSKFAISYDGTKYTRYANGVKLGTNTVSASMSNWDTLKNGNLSYSGVDRIFNIADLKLYNTALSDSEAIALTQV